jgi:hypothetical protein
MNPYSPPADFPAPYPPAPLATAPTASPGAVTELAVDLLRQTRPWVMFLGVLFLIASAGMLLLALLMVGVGLMSGASGPEKTMQALVGVVYLPLSALYVYPGIKMWAYGSAIGRLVASRSTEDLEAALGQQKSLWKFSGIAAIVIIGLYVVLFIALFAVGIAAGLGKV